LKVRFFPSLDTRISFHILHWSFYHILFFPRYVFVCSESSFLSRDCFCLLWWSLFSYFSLQGTFFYHFHKISSCWSGLVFKYFFFCSFHDFIICWVLVLVQGLGVPLFLVIKIFRFRRYVLLFSLWSEFHLSSILCAIMFSYVYNYFRYVYIFTISFDAWFSVICEIRCDKAGLF
jgi:hypothetical protein